MIFLRKLLAIFFLFITASAVSFGQEMPKTNEEIFKKFMGVIEAQDESALLQAIEGGSTEIKAICFEVLGRKGITENTKIVLDRYINYGLDYTKPVHDNYPTWMVRYRVALAMAQSKMEGFVTSLAQLLRLETESFVILAAIYALGEIGSPNGTEAILTHIRIAKNPAIVYEATLALGKIGDQRALAELMYVVQSGEFSFELREAAIDAISKLKK